MKSPCKFFLFLFSISPVYSFCQANAVDKQAPNFDTLLHQAEKKFDLGEYSESLQLNLQALKIAEAAKDCPREAIVNYKVARNYFYIGTHYNKFGQAIKYYEVALERAGRCGVDSIARAALSSLGAVYLQLKEQDTAELYFDRLEPMMGNAPPIEAARFYSLFSAFQLENKKDIEKGLFYAKKAEQIAAASGNLDGLAFAKIRIGGCYKTSKDYRRANDYFQQALTIYENTQNIEGQLFALSLVRQFYVLQNNAKMVEELMYKQTALKDSIFNAKSAEGIAHYQTLYETEKKEQQIKVQQLEIDNQQQRIRFQRTLTGSIAAGLLAIFGFLFLRSRQKQQRRLQEEAIRHQERLLQATVESVEAERKRISKDLHDGIGQQLSGLKMAWQQLSEKWRSESPAQAEKLDGLTNILNDAATEVRNISHQMMPASLRQLGLTAALQDMLQKSFSHTSVKYEFEQMGADGRFAENIEIGLYRIAQELINNIIKHSNAQSVSVELFKTKTHLVLTVEDDGKGFDMENMEDAGNGLHNISSRAKSVKGKIQFEQRSGSGVSATVRVPIG
ncbi:MAG TPA: hypothetical protein ENJ95_08365 [Bacteroidetes bacterium]|nr:hypothetical protein [Bacteroidota bacterium]